MLKDKHALSIHLQAHSFTDMWWKQEITTVGTLRQCCDTVGWATGRASDL